MKPVIRRKRRLNKREAVLMAAVLITVIVLIVWQTAGRNLFQDIAGLSERKSMLSTEMAVLEEVISRKDSIENKWARLQEDETRLNILLPEISELPSAFGKLESIVEYYDSQITSFQAGEIETAEGYISLPFTLCAEGSPFIITAIIKALESFPHLLIIEYLRWTSIEGNDAAIEVSFKIYFYNELKGGY
jgi:Tfp pilus assembly protein PilO